MKKLMIAIVAAVVAGAFTMSAYAGAACCPATAKTSEAGKAKTACKAEAKTSCPIAKGCKVEGKTCDKSDANCQVLSIKDGKAACCACAKDCKSCTVKEGETKCSCGKDVKTCDLKGKFACTHCKTIADKAGKCACSAELKEVK